jgi:integrase
MHRYAHGVTAPNAPESLPGVTRKDHVSKKLTAISVSQARPGVSRREIPDGGCPGLYLVVQPSGTKSFGIRFRSPVDLDGHGRRAAKKLTLGPLAIGEPEDEPKIGHPLTLMQARALAAAALERVKRGEDPTHKRREERAKERDKIALNDTVDEAFVEFLGRYRGKKRQGLRDSTRLLTATHLGLKPSPDDPKGWVKTDSGVLRAWSGRSLSAITKNDVIRLVEQIADKGHGVKANRTLTVLKTFFGWAVKRDMIGASPAAVVDAPAEEKSRSRTLTDIEVAALWRAAESYGYPFGSMTKLLLLTAARRDELREAPWAEIDLGEKLWSLPAVRAKNNREHLVPLSDTALAILKKMPRLKGGLLFTTTGATPASGLSGAKRRIDALMVANLRETDRKYKLEPWTWHDLRRTVASGLQRLGFPIEAVEAVLNHKSGTLRGVAAVYARHNYLPEKTRALDAWAAHIANITGAASGGSNVIELRPGA